MSQGREVIELMRRMFGAGGPVEPTQVLMLLNRKLHEQAAHLQAACDILCGMAWDRGTVEHLVSKADTAEGLEELRAFLALPTVQLSEHREVIQQRRVVLG